MAHPCPPSPLPSPAQGVNDAPALKRADIGIAVHGATDAARAAADIVLTEEGLSVIIDAIFESRKIFQRMRNYIIYRIACTFQVGVGGEAYKGAHSSLSPLFPPSCSSSCSSGSPSSPCRPTAPSCTRAATTRPASL